MKYEWRKQEKTLYLPKGEAEKVTVPAMNFFTVKGKENPNDESFGEYIKVLYSLAYGVRMSPKSGMEPPGYFEYTVYPLEGVWDLSEKGRAEYNGTLDKDELVFTLMIRQPDFVKADFFGEILAHTMKKKPHRLLEQVEFQSLEEGLCVQMMHLGPYADEPISFARMEEFCQSEGLIRKCMTHREIYLSDPKKSAPEKLKTVLRFGVM
jgi:hypothetical protein